MTDNLNRPISKRMYTTIFMAIGLSIPGCVRTFDTRSTVPNGEPFFGGPPYLTVRDDLKFIAHPLMGRADIMQPLAAISLPVDIILDTVFLISDLLAWTCGVTRSSSFEELNR